MSLTRARERDITWMLRWRSTAEKICLGISLLLAMASLSAELRQLSHYSICIEKNASATNAESKLISQNAPMQAGRKLLIAYAAGFLADIRSCMVKDIQIEQRETAPELGYPQFHVQISNNCMAGCTAHKIHVSCGDFHSYTGLNPATFRKLAYDNCLVLNGGPLETGKTVSFHYSSTFRYKLAAKLAVYFC